MREDIQLETPPISPVSSKNKEKFIKETVQGKSLSKIKVQRIRPVHRSLLDRCFPTHPATTALDPASYSPESRNLYGSMGVVANRAIDPVSYFIPTTSVKHLHTKARQQLPVGKPHSQLSRSKRRTRRVTAWSEDEGDYSGVILEEEGPEEVISSSDEEETPEVPPTIIDLKEDSESEEESD